MPFDAMVAVTRQRTVSEALARHGLSPVPLGVLATHKQAQREKFGPSFWYRHQAAVSMILVVASPAVGVLAGVIYGFGGHSSAVTIGSSFAWMCMVAVRSEERRVGKECRSRWSPYH